MNGRSVPARTQVLVCALAGAVVAVPVIAVSHWYLGVLAGWGVAVAAYMTWVWTRVWPLDATRTARLAAREDPTRAATDLLLLSAAVASLVAVGFAIASAAHASGTAEFARVALGVASVALSWGLVHTVYALRYARLYYDGDDDGGGIDFNGEGPPAYVDFAYLAFTIGMTFQVSDTALQTRTLRSAALHHALLSFLFGTGILATTVNLVASLTSR
jgi:uncharacterized membrane protein